MSKIGDYNLELEEQKLRSLMYSKETTKADVLQEHIEYLEFELKSLKSELKATVKEYNREVGSLDNKEVSEDEL